MLVAAKNSKLKNVIGKNWIAVGDAAAAYDPLSSQGVMLALGTGTGVRMHYYGISMEKLLPRQIPEESKLRPPTST